MLSMETNLQNFLAILRERNPSLAKHLTLEATEIMRDMMRAGFDAPTWDNGLYDMAEQIVDALDNYFPGGKNS